MLKALEGTPGHARSCGETLLRKVHRKPAGLETGGQLSLKVLWSLPFHRQHIIHSSLSPYCTDNILSLVEEGCSPGLGHFRDQTSTAACSARGSLFTLSRQRPRAEARQRKRCASAATCPDGSRKSSGDQDTANTRPDCAWSVRFRIKHGMTRAAASPFHRSGFQHSRSNDGEHHGGGGKTQRNF